jgi:hypothetical protein
MKITNFLAMPVIEGEDGWLCFSAQVYFSDNCRWHWEYHPLMPSNGVASIQSKEYLAT